MASPPDNSPKNTRQRKRTEKKVGAKGLPCAQHPKTNLATRCPPRSPIKHKKKKRFPNHLFGAAVRFVYVFSSPSCMIHMNNKGRRERKDKNTEGFWNPGRPGFVGNRITHPTATTRSGRVSRPPSYLQDYSR